ncbi:hypothetical protein [Acidianus sp. HS-5]|uniref:hypothetical protein n=1 Tax=Acidianus sp. HS-5 TaxID=2886040 RepID=UPI001F1E97EA|nr:hypothetical protein [Acidianus sp. HS-5]BDC19645.1 hypothetical protein HS5_25350 [Acidianus sp. HS-5]
MKISEVPNIYLLDLKNMQIIIEELKTEKGEKIYSIYQDRKYSINEEKEWTPDIDKAKKIKEEELPVEVAKYLNKLGISVKVPKVEKKEEKVENKEEQKQ